MDVAELQRELERAVAEERYEDAARLRDRIAALRGSAPAPDRRRDAT
ncbi:MAG: UvrB/UvrC motif-containing protein [Kiritimatiellae bacterium]|nr:UvrB/UvrC motif-containing protein [Kiritimatiellia bacterium]